MSLSVFFPHRLSTQVVLARVLNSITLALSLSLKILCIFIYIVKYIYKYIYLTIYMYIYISLKRLTPSPAVRLANAVLLVNLSQFLIFGSYILF